MQRTVKPKEIWKVAIADTEGHEQKGDRPAVIIAVHNQANVSMVVPLTKNQDASRFPYTHSIKRTPANGLPINSVALIFQMRSLTISESRFLYRIGTIEQYHFDQIKTLIKDYLKLI